MKQLLDLLPENSREYVRHYLSLYPMDVYITRARQSKLGDFRPAQNGQRPAISLNRDMSADGMLFTLIHELAHHQAYHRYGRKINPHGREWKLVFREMVMEMIHDKAFSEEVVPLILRHMKAPKSSTIRDKELYRVLHPQEAKTEVGELGPGALFIFRKRKFRIIEKRRTRWICEEIANGRSFLFQAHTPVEKVEV